MLGLLNPSYCFREFYFYKYQISHFDYLFKNMLTFDYLFKNLLALLKNMFKSYIYFILVNGNLTI